MTKQFLASLILAVGLMIGILSPASACNVQIGRPGSCDSQYRQAWANGQYGNGGAMDPRGWNGGRRAMRTNGAANNYYGRVGAGYYGSVAVPRARAAAPPPPPPSPEQVYQNQLRAGKVTQTRTPVDCVSTHTRVEGSNRCQSITWVPGED